MAADVLFRLSDDVARTKHTPIVSPSSCATRVRINPACVFRPEEDAAARDAKRRHRCGEERRRSPDVKWRRRDDARVVSPDASGKREIVKHRRDRDEESQESKRRRRDDARRVSPDGKSKRKRESVDDGRRGSSASSRSSFGRPRPGMRGDHDLAPRREDDRRTFKIKERERDTTRGRSRSGSARSESSPTRARQDPCAAQAQQQLPVAAVVIPRTISVDGRPLQEYTESFEEAELRRRETQQKREEARRMMDKVVQTVYFDDPYISPLDLFKR